MIDISLPTTRDTERFAACLATSFSAGCRCYFSGELGAGKTFFIRALLRAHGITGAIRSPTFTLIETYQANDKIFYHFDCYRYDDPQELEEVGVRDYFRDDAIILLEWPEKGQSILPLPDCHFCFQIDGNGRKLSVQSHSFIGEQILQKALACQEQQAS